MRGLVTVFGGSGFVGRSVVRALARRGWRVRVAVRRPHVSGALKMAGDVGQVQLVAGDVRHDHGVEPALDGAEACVNLVGILQEGGGQGFATIQADGARRVAEAAAARGITRFVQISAIGADADSPSAYARSKAEGEAAVREHVPSAVILRPSIVFGAEDSFFNRFARMAAISPALPLIGGGHTRFQPVYVGDVAEAVARALETPAFAGRTFELGGPQVFTFRELMERTLQEIGRRRFLAPLPFPVARLVGRAFDLVRFLPIPAAITADQVALLQTDNIVGDDAEGFAALGLSPTSVDAVLPTYLWRYRKHGQFADIGGPGLQGSARQT